MELDDWTTALANTLGVPANVDTRALLDLARVAAHNVDRPAAPLTTYLVGYAAATNGGTAEALREAVTKATALADGWARTTGAGATSPDRPG